MSKVDRPNGALARNVRRIGHLDLPGAGQVTVAGHYAYVGHIPNKRISAPRSSTSPIRPIRAWWRRLRSTIRPRTATRCASPAT